MAAPTSETTARAMFEALLMLDDAKCVETERAGWVGYDISQATVHENRARYRGNRMQNFFANTFGPGQERFIKIWRAVQIGRLTLEGWAGGDVRARLSIVDSTYKPINPVNGDTAITRQLRALYLVHATTDADGDEYQSGITFNFLERQDEPTVYGNVSYHVLEAPDRMMGNVSRETTNFLEAHGFGTTSQELNPRMIDLAVLCIDQAGSWRIDPGHMR